MNIGDQGGLCHVLGPFPLGGAPHNIHSFFIWAIIAVNPNTCICGPCCVVKAIITGNTMFGQTEGIFYSSPRCSPEEVSINEAQKYVNRFLYSLKE